MVKSSNLRVVAALLLLATPAFAAAPSVTVGYLPPGVKILKSYDEAPSPAPKEPEVPEDRPASRHLDLLVKNANSTDESNAYICVSELITADAAKFPSVHSAKDALKTLLFDRPAPDALLAYKPDGSPEIELPDFPFPDAYQALRAHVTYLDTPWGAGYAEVVQFAQDETRASNDHLEYYFQGITSDGKYYVSASFAVTNPKLPASYEAAIQADPQGTIASDIKKLNALHPDTFTPPLAELQKLIESIKITPK